MPDFNEKNNKVPVWFDVLIRFYIGLNALLGALHAINPIIVVGPGHTVLEVKTRIVGTYLLKVLGAIMIRRKGKMGLILFTLACIFSTWLASPFFWANLDTKLLILDWGILAMASYFLFTVHGKSLP